MQLNTTSWPIALTALFLSTCQNCNANNLRTIIKNYSGADNRGKYNIQVLQLSDNSKTIFKKINTALKAVLFTDLRCEPDNKKKNDMWTNSWIGNIYLTTKTLSFSQQVDGYCGGPYPDAYTTFYNYDIETGKKILLAEKINARSQLLKAIYQKFLIKAKGAKIPDCNHLYTINEFKQTTIQYRLIQNGIIARLSYPHVARACELSIKINQPEINSSLYLD